MQFLIFEEKTILINGEPHRVVYTLPDISDEGNAA